MRLHRRLGFGLAILIAAAGIGGAMVISRLWCDTADFADQGMRPLGAPASYVPPPGPVYLENDSYYWLSYAQRVARGEDWRIRHTMMDNFPTGREMHWSQSVTWSMVVFGWVRALFTHENLATAIEKASVAINPLLFALAAAGLFVALVPRLGTLPAALLLAYLGSTGDVGWTFQALRPGHQGFHVVFGAASVLGLVFGGMGLTTRQAVGARERWPLFQTPGPVDLVAARRWFTLAGVATGMALWVSATIESFFIYPMMGAFVGLLVLVPPGRLAAENLVVEPDLWRRWGLTAGVTGFAFYLLEYFPHHLAMRIEVNHPVYDLAVVGSGEALRWLSRWRWGDRRPMAAGVLLALLALALSALPVLLIARGPIAWHHLRDPQMLRLHNFIQEFYTYNNFYRVNRLGNFLHAFGILPLVSLLAPFFLLRRNLAPSQVTWLWMTFALAGSFGVASYAQVRWLGFFAAAVCLSATVAAHFAFGLVPAGSFARGPAAVAVLAVALLWQPAEFYRRQIVDLSKDLQGASLEQEIVTPLLNKRMAFALKASPDRPRAVIADPGLAPSLGYFAGIPCLTSFYWENTEGLHNAVRFFTAKDPAVAHEVAVRTGATHVIIPPGSLLPNYWYFVAYGHYDTAAAPHTFAAKLLDGVTPSWIQPDTVLNFITTDTYSYRGAPVANRYETFRIQN